MEFAVISESLSSPSFFQCVDIRETLYSTNNYHPTSSINPIMWSDTNVPAKYIHPMVGNGDLCVTKELAELIMSFDPYGIEVYPASLITKDKELSNRYILAINNIQDVADLDRCNMEVSSDSGKLLIYRLYLSEEKIKKIASNKRVIYRDKVATTTVFFTPKIYDLIKDDERFMLLRKLKKDTSMRAPKF